MLTRLTTQNRGWYAGYRLGGLVSCRLRRGAVFFASPDRWTSVWCHDEVVRL